MISEDPSSRITPDTESYSETDDMKPNSDLVPSVYTEQAQQRLSNTLRDELAQVLSAIQFDLQWVERSLSPAQSKVKDHLAAMQGLVNKSIQQVNQIASELHPRMLDDMGLAAALDWYLCETLTTCTVKFEDYTDLQQLNHDLNQTQQLRIYRWIQQLVDNLNNPHRLSGSLRLTDDQYCFTFHINFNLIDEAADTYRKLDKLCQSKTIAADCEYQHQSDKLILRFFLPVA